MDMIEYGVAFDFYIPIPKAGSTDFALSADWTPATGDVKISKDGGAEANITTLPSAPGSTTGKWKFPISSGEATCKQGLITVIDSATKAVVDQAIRFGTFGNPNALWMMNLNLRNDALKAIFYGSVTGAVTTTTLIDSTLVQADTDFFKGRILLPLSGTQRYQGSKITAFDASTHKLTFDTMTVAMANGDLYAIC